MFFSILLVAAITRSNVPAYVLAAGMLAIFVALAILIWSRWGQARPISKCVALSLVAHLLLLIYAYSTHFLYGPPGHWLGQTVTVRLADAADDVEAAPTKSDLPEPWRQAGETDVPLAATAPPLLAESPPKPAAEKPPPAAEAPAVQLQPPLEPPQLTQLLPDQSPELQTGPAEDLPPNPLRQQPPENPDRQLATDTAPIPSPPTKLDEQFVAATKPSAPRRLGDGEEIPQPLQARVAADRLKAAQPFGATPHTEAAVAAALDWLAAAQSSDGRWDADAHGAGRETRSVLGHDRRDPRGRRTGAEADTGITGLALLAFLGAGETHLEGKHRETVQRGLEFVLGSQASDGNLAGNAELFAAMYCHGMATLALSEAYALSGDARLLDGLRRALQYTINAQHAGGGWRYQPHDAGDMSQFGWQLMALKSAELGGISIPATTRTRMLSFLQSCSAGKRRGLASYRSGEAPSRTMTAEALVCRFFLDAENSPGALDEGAAFVSSELPGSGTLNYYYWYYGTLAMFQRQGEDWARWNAALQRELLWKQRSDGAAAGSWDDNDLFGGYGGRVYSTALATLSLEVYYRYLPVHGHTPDDSRLTDRPSPPAVSR